MTTRRTASRRPPARGRARPVDPAPPPAGPPAAGRRYRMKDLSARTGLPRQAIHFYIREGLVPEGEKSGRNMAWYGDAHVERIRLVKQLQEERFLPLKAIRAVLEQRDEAFTPAQRGLLAEVKRHLATTVAAGALAAPALVPVQQLLEEAGVDWIDFQALHELGLFVIRMTPAGPAVARDDAWLLELWGHVRRAGFTSALGFTPAVLAFFEDAVAQLFAREVKVLGDRLAHLPAGQVATLIERVLPLVHTFLVRCHESKVRTFFAALE